MSAPTWKVELHSHTVYSKDCLIPLRKLREICHRSGIDKLAITDHNRAGAALEMYKLYPMWIIPGEEIMTTDGEILGWFIKEEIPAGLEPMEVIGRLRNQGAVTGVAHPFDRYRKGAWTTEGLNQIVNDVDCIEVFNARCVNSGDNERALAFAKAHNKLMTCGSDAHTPTEFGTATLTMKPFSNSSDGFRQALESSVRHERLSSPFVHFGSTYARFIKRLIPSLNVS